MGQQEKQWMSDSPTSPEEGQEGRHVMVSWLTEGPEGREKEQRKGAIKTLTSNLVYCVKKSHMHSRPRAPTRLPVWPWWTLAPGFAPVPSQVRSEQSCAAAAAGWWRGLRPVCWSHCWREGGWTGRMTREEHRNASFQIKKLAVYTQLFVLVQYKQNKKSLL